MIAAVATPTKPEIEERQAEVLELYDAFFPEPDIPAFDPSSTPGIGNDLTADELIQKAIASSPRFRARHYGDISGYPSPSEALCGQAASCLWWANGDYNTAFEMLRASDLAQREKEAKRPELLHRALKKVSGGFKGGYTGRQNKDDIEPEYQKADAAPEDPAPEDVKGADRIAELEQQLRLLRLENSILRNAAIRQEAPTLIELVEIADRRTRAGKADEHGYVHINYQWVAKNLKLVGDPPNGDRQDPAYLASLKGARNRISRHVKVGVKLGLLDKINVPLWIPMTETTGEVKSLKINQTYFRLRGTLIEHLSLLANFARSGADERNWGGNRPCKGCGSQAVINKQYCADCAALRREVWVDADGNKTVVYDQDKP